MPIALQTAEGLEGSTPPRSAARSGRRTARAWPTSAVRPPRWSADGATVYFTRRKAVMAAAVRVDPDGLRTEIPQRLFDSPTWPGDLEVIENGEAFLFAEQDGGHAGPVTVVPNWWELLKD